MTDPSAPSSPTLSLQQTLLRRALAAHEAGRLHLRFDARVVERYRRLSGAQVMRTSSVGRVSVPGRWSLDLGIVAGDGEVHLPMQDLLDRLPEQEWPHWIEHLVETPASVNFLKMRQASAACIDDGEPERWE
jgi:hypothetical protein